MKWARYIPYYIAILIAILFEVGWFLLENWEQLSVMLALSSVAFIIGKRIGVKLTVDYIVKTFRLQKKSALEQQVEHHEIQIRNLGGEPWNVALKVSKGASIGGSSRLRWATVFPAQFAGSFIRQSVIKLLISLRRMNMEKLKSRKLWMAVLGGLILVINEQFGINLSNVTLANVAATIMAYIAAQAAVDTNGLGQFAPMIEKLKSHKLWATLIVSTVTILNDALGWGMSEVTIQWLVGIGITHILGKAAVSVVKASKDNSGEYN